LAGTFTRFCAPAPAANNTLPPTDTTPASGCSSPAMDRNVVDLPQPDGPNSVNNSPGSTLKLTSLTAKTLGGSPFGDVCPRERRFCRSPSNVLIKF
jgi:hypothetical protein